MLEQVSLQQKAFSVQQFPLTFQAYLPMIQSVRHQIRCFLMLLVSTLPLNQLDYQV